jgi:Na+-translocating ferredoxin:NAD+ oxidoreductase RnfC subunit
MSIIDKIFEAGIVGCGGAGFPTHVKLKCTVPYLIINGAECEPLLHTDRWIMCNKPAEILKAAIVAGETVKARECVIALKSTYIKEISSLEAAISELGAPVKLHKMDAYYPAGDEQQIVYEVTGKVVPAGGIPLDVGAVVVNVATMLCVHDAIAGKPFIRKYLTVTGEVKNPSVINVPLGTPLSRCIELAGGALSARYFAVLGGPMMGVPMTMEQLAEEVVTKTTSGIILLTEDSYLSNHSAIDMGHTINRARSVCIQCTLCTQLCPRYLLGHPLQPHRIMRQLAMSGDILAILDDPFIRQAQICCECGVCEYIACPMELQPCKINKMIKSELAKAGIRYKKQDMDVLPDPFREERKIPTGKAVARVEVSQYDDMVLSGLIKDTPDSVLIPLKMHIGAPSMPVVSVGDSVEEGQLIAICPDGALGANIHASISGKVSSVGDRIVITGGGM